MIIFPAIDIKDNKCVRLEQGNFNKLTSYSENPLEVAKQWEAQGAEYIHIVDLDGAKSQSDKNFKTIETIINSVNIKLQLGGGIRSIQSAETLLNMGIDRIILGTAAVKNPLLLDDLSEKFCLRIAVSIDAIDGRVAVDGWQEISESNILSICKYMELKGIKTLICTDISKDGMLSGPNFELYKDLKANTNLDIIASGGIATLSDIKKLKTLDIYGTIVGKALYEGIFKLEEALKC